MISFDIFDTLVTRSTAVPTGIFGIMQNILLRDMDAYGVDKYFAENFYDQRVAWETLLRKQERADGAEDITLKQIYDAMVAGGCVNCLQAERIRQLELHVEYENILPLHKNIEIVKNFYEQGERVVLISDMYLSAKEIKGLLCKVDSFFETMTIYVSSEYKKTKASGNLYREIEKLEKVSFDEWTHYGDNIISDVKVPLSLGIHAINIEIKRPMPYEERLLNVYRKDSFVQSMVGISEYLNKSSSEGEYEIIGKSYGGPIIYSYISWVLETSLKQGIQRLYFVARDGWILKKSADIMIENRKLAIKTYYIYGSRKAWRMASISKEDCNFSEVLTNSGKSSWKSIDDIAELLQISTDELVELLPYGYQCLAKADTNIFRDYVYDIIQYIINDSRFQAFLLNKHEENRRLVQEYIYENIDLSDDRFAFVELSGSGYTQICVTNILKQIKTCKVRSFFMQIDKIWNKKDCCFYVFFPNIIPNHYIIEMLCRAPHGQTEGYTKEQGQVIPVLEKQEGEFIKKSGYMDYVKGVLDFITQYERINTYNRIPNSTKLIEIYLRYAAENTGTEIQHFFENMPFSTCDVEEGQIYAPPLTREQLKSQFLWNEVPTSYQGASIIFALDHLSKKHIRIKAYYIWLSSTIYGRWRIKNRHNRIYGLNGRQRYFYPKGIFSGRLILYAAGKVGRDYYKQIRKDKNVELVAWTDSNYSNLQEEQKKILVSADEIVNFCYDFILVAVARRETYEKIGIDLAERGIEEKRIVWIRPLVKW